jgi:hypothetical protein
MKSLSATVILAVLALFATACDESDPILPDAGTDAGTTPRPDASPLPDAGLDAGLRADAGEIEPPCDITQTDDIVSDLLVRRGCRLFVTRWISVGSGATLTLEAGSQMVMSAGVYLYIGGYNDQTPGRIIAQGTEAEPVLITSAAGTPAPGDWASIELTDSVLEGTKFEYVVFEYGGGNASSLYPAVIHFENPEDVPGGRISIDHCTFRNNAGAAVGMSERASSDPASDLLASFTYNTVTGTSGPALLLHPNVVGSIGVGSSFEAPILVKEDELSGVTRWLDHGVPYVLEGRLTLGGPGARLVLSNTTVLAEAGAQIYLDGGDLDATSVRFASAAPVPEPGDWLGFTQGTARGVLSLQDCTISHVDATANGNSAVVQFYDRDEAARATITGSNFSENVGIANIDVDFDGGPDPVACARFTDAAASNRFDLTIPCQ